MLDPFLKRYFPWLLLVGIALNIPGLFLDIIEPDGALYATLAKHIVIHRDWINLFGDGHDWLDKPHFPFWMAALSFKVFGITSFAYKLPAFLFWLASLRYTYLLGRDLYNKDVAKVSVLIYAVAYHSVLANFDVRAEPYLTCCIIASTWHMLAVYRQKHRIHIVAAALFAAFAMMTKGIFALLTIAGGWVIYWLFTKQFKQFVNPRWWLMLVLSLVFIGPELYSLYVQFDLHPEKEVFGKTGVSGIRFFFWDSQFGRFFNTGPIKGKGSLTFFLHTTLWAFLPWSVGLVSGIVYLIRFDKQRDPLRWIVYGSTLATFLLFSLSKFQLPHYLVILFPYFSLITAYFLCALSVRGKLKPFAVFQSVLVFIGVLFVAGLVYITDIPNGLYAVVAGAVIAIAAIFIPQRNALHQLLVKGYALSAILYIFIFLYFYPFLLEYQSGRAAAAHIPVQDKDLPAAAYGSFSYSFEFYAPGDVRLLNSHAALTDFVSRAPCYLYTTKAIADSVINANRNAEVKTVADHFHVTRLKYGFLNHKTRAEYLEPRYLLYFKN